MFEISVKVPQAKKIIRFYFEDGLTGLDLKKRIHESLILKEEIVTIEYKRKELTDDTVIKSTDFKKGQLRLYFRDDSVVLRLLKEHEGGNLDKLIEFLVYEAKPHLKYHAAHLKDRSLDIRESVQFRYRDYIECLSDDDNLVDDDFCFDVPDNTIVHESFPV